MKRFNFQEARDQRFDVLVIGGGLLGTAIARESAVRGYRTCLLEKDDFGSGSTCHAPHSLLGYPLFAERSDFRLRRQIEQERQHHLHLAPHLCRPLDAVFVALKGRKQPAGLKSGPLSSLKEWLLPEGSIGRVQNLPLGKLGAACPGLKLSAIESAYTAVDAAVNSSTRLCLEHLLSAGNHGAVAANYAKVVSIQVHNRQIQGLALEDRISGKMVRLQGRCIINAAGPWMDQICRMADDRFISHHRVFRDTYAIVLQPKPPLQKILWFGSSRNGALVEVFPWQNYLVLGPVTQDAGPDPEAPQESREEIIALINEVRELLPGLGSTESGSCYARTSLRFAAADSGGQAIARGNPPWIVDHGRAGGPKGLLTAVGSRLFNYQRIAQQAVDAAKSHAGTPEKAAGQALHEPLYGGNIQNMGTFIEEVTNAARNFGLTDFQVSHLVHLYGTKSQDIFQWLKSHPELQEPICPNHPDIKAQLLYAVEREMAVTVGDVLLRRTLIGTTGCRGLDCAQAVATTLARHLGWSEARVRAETDNYQDELKRTFWEL